MQSRGEVLGAGGRFGAVNGVGANGGDGDTVHDHSRFIDGHFLRPRGRLIRKKQP